MVPKKGGAANIIIPADLVEEILHRLPSNDLLRFQLVSKEWLRLISSPEFIQKHLERSKANSHYPHIVNFYPYQILIQGYSANNRTSNKKIDARGHDVRLLGSCDGLILYHKPVVGEIEALNPSTGTVAVNARLTKPSTEKNDDDVLGHHMMCTWFGHHPVTREYVLVVASSEYPKLLEMVEVMSV